jgi:hypothetical protein
MIRFRTYERKELEFPGLYTFEELLHESNNVKGLITFYGGFYVKKTEEGSLICREALAEIGRLGDVSQDLFSIPEEPRTHIFWFRNIVAANKFLMRHCVEASIFDDTKPVPLEIPRISFFKDWSDD